MQQLGNGFSHALQFKNALHFPPSPSEILGYPQSSLKVESISGMPGFACNASYGTGSQPADGLGITMDDEGHLLIAEWKEGKVEGRYFMFKPNLVEGPQSEGSSGICQYGSMQNGALQGDNYLYTVGGTVIKAYFQSNQCGQNCLMIPHALNRQTKMRHQAYTLKTYQMSPQSSPQKEQSKTEQQFELPAFFFGALLEKHYQPDSGRQKFVVIEVNINQHFVGFSTEEEPPIQKASESPSENNCALATGFGIMFRQWWPCMYGQFHNSRLSGRGVIYETQLNRNEGVFRNDLLLNGFIIDFFSNTASYGHMVNCESDDVQFRVQKRLNPATQYSQVIEWKRRQHLRALNFNNQYFPLPSLIHRSPWPYSVIRRLTPAIVTQEIIECFNPQMNHKSLPRIVGQSERQSFKRSPSQANSQMNSYLSRKVLDSYQENFIDYEIEKEISERNEVSEKTMSVGKYVQLYNLIDHRTDKHRISQRVQEMKNHENKTTKRKQAKPWSKQKSSAKKNLGYFPSMAHPISQIPKTTKQSQTRLESLLQELADCQQERKNTLTVKPSKQILSIQPFRQQPVSKVASKRQLMKQDERNLKKAMEKQKVSKPIKDHDNIDLHQIYKQFLRP